MRASVSPSVSAAVQRGQRALTGRERTSGLRIRSSPRLAAMAVAGRSRGSFMTSRPREGASSAELPQRKKGREDERYEHREGGREQVDVARWLHRRSRPRDGLGPASHRRLRGAGRCRGDRGGHRRDARRPADLGRRRRGWRPTSPAARTTPSRDPCSSSPIGRRTRRTRASRSSPVTSGKRSPRRWTLRAARTWRSSAPTWPASACGEGSSTRSWCIVLPVLLGDGIRFSPPGLPMIALEPISSTRSRDATILRFRVRT